jgi:phage/plasmid-like protein (TIGR03299 family)
MAHMVEEINGVAQMAYTGDVPWHGLGKRVSNDLSPEQMLEAAGLNWGVEKVPLFADYNGKQIRTGAEALVRDLDDKVLTIVTDTWNPCQNRDAFEFFNDFTAAGDMEMHTAGSLKGGQHVWALAKIKESFELFGGDKVDGYLLFSNPHQFGKSITVQFTPIRVVCNNTLTLSLGTKTDKMVKVNHRRVFDGDDVKETLGVAKDKLAKYKEMSAFLGKKLYTPATLIEYFNQVFPKTSDKKNDKHKIGVPQSRAAELAMVAVDAQPGAEFAKGSWWQAYNAVTYLTDHQLGRSTDTRLYSAWYGVNQAKKVQALNLAVQMAEAA